MATESDALELDGQGKPETIKERKERIFDSGQWADCVFIVGTESNQEKIQAHKLILAMASPVFEAMFYGLLVDPDGKPIPVPDVTPETFKLLLKYIYTDEINFTTFDECCEIFYTAKKYIIPSLAEACATFIVQNLDPANVCRGLELCQLFENIQLKKKCLQVIKIRTNEVIDGQSFEEGNINTLKEILSMEKMHITEFELWEGTLKWSQLECIRQDLEVNPINQRKVIEELLPLIRFLTMDALEFTIGPAQSNILNHEECLNILMNLTSPDIKPMLPNLSSSRDSRRKSYTRREFKDSSRFSERYKD